MTKHITDIRACLGELADLAQQVEGDERCILTKAESRLIAINALLDAKQRYSSTDCATPDCYAPLIHERAQLLAIIAKARKVLGQ